MSVMDQEQLLSRSQQLPEELVDPGGSMPADEALSMVLRQRAWMETGTIMSAQAARDWYAGERAARNSGSPSADTQVSHR